MLISLFFLSAKILTAEPKILHTFLQCQTLVFRFPAMQPGTFSEHWAAYPLANGCSLNPQPSSRDEVHAKEV